MKTLPILTSSLLAAGALLCGCSSTNYGDPDKTETLTDKWGSTDLQSFADYMTGSLLDSPNLAYLDSESKGADKRIIAVFGGITNETSEHINTNQISRRIQANLVNSGKMRVVAGAEAFGQDEIAKQIRFQQDSGMVDPALAQRARQLGAEVIIYGALSDIKKEKGRSLESGFTKRRDNYYQFYMTAVRVDTAELLWAEEEDIRKTTTVGMFGRG